MFKWKSKEQGTKFVSLYETNITLNKPASVHFNHAYSVMLGVDSDGKKLGIKPLSKEEFQRGDIGEELLYKISLRSSYARISNKSFVTDLAAQIGLDFETQTMYKLNAEWDDQEKVLVVDLQSLEEERHNG